MTKTIKTNFIISVLVAVLMLSAIVGCVYAIAQYPSTVSGSIIAVDDSGNMMNETKVYEMPQNLMFSGEALAAADGAGVSVKLQATVIPTTAIYKAVDWSVAWGDSSNETDVTNYVTVIADADGSTNATVTCYQVFTGNIIVTVTTRDGGFKANCTVSFVGKPTTISTSTSLNHDADIYYTQRATENIVSIDLSNVFDSVGNSYKNFTYTLSSVGTFRVGVKNDDGVYDYHGQYPLIDIQNLYFGNENITLSGSTLTIKPKNTYFSSTDRKYFVSDGQHADFGLAEFAGYNENSYHVLTITEPITGLSCSFKFQVKDTSVSGVAVSNPAVEF